MTPEHVAVLVLLVPAAAWLAWQLPGQFRELWNGSPVCGVCGHAIAYHRAAAAGLPARCSEWACVCSTPVLEAE